MPAGLSYSHETVGVPLYVRLHPTQIYEAVASLMIFVVLWQALKRKRYDGQVFILYLVLYSITRFSIEFLRGDPERGFVFGGVLSTSQLISIFLIIFAAVLFSRLKKKTLANR